MLMMMMVMMMMMMLMMMMLLMMMMMSPLSPPKKNSHPAVLRLRHRLNTTGREAGTKFRGSPEHAIASPLGISQFSYKLAINVHNHYKMVISWDLTTINGDLMVIHPLVNQPL